MDLPNHITLTPNELTQIRNFNIGKRICEAEIQKIGLKEEMWLNTLSNRLNLDIRRYNINIDTGICTLIRPEDLTSTNGVKNGVDSPERVSETKPEQVLDKPQT